MGRMSPRGGGGGGGHAEHSLWGENDQGSHLAEEGPWWGHHRQGCWRLGPWLCRCLGCGRRVKSRASPLVPQYPRPRHGPGKGSRLLSVKQPTSAV